MGFKPYQICSGSPYQENQYGDKSLQERKSPLVVLQRKVSSVTTPLVRRFVTYQVSIFVQVWLTGSVLNKVRELIRSSRNHVEWLLADYLILRGIVVVVCKRR